MGTNRYAYGLNDPINLQDRNGEAALPLTTGTLNNLVAARRGGFTPNTPQDAGNILETVVRDHLNAAKNTQRFTSIDRMSLGGPPEVVPDMIGSQVIGEGKEKVTVGTIFVEVKAVSSRAITPSYDVYEIHGQIDALDTIRGESDILQTLSFITTSDTRISRNVVDYATERGVVVTQTIVYYDVSSGLAHLGRPTVLNPEAIPPGLGMKTGVLQNIPGAQSQ